MTVWTASGRTTAGTNRNKPVHETRRMARAAAAANAPAGRSMHAASPANSPARITRTGRRALDVIRRLGPSPAGSDQGVDREHHAAGGRDVVVEGDRERRQKRAKAG